MNSTVTYDTAINATTEIKAVHVRAGHQQLRIAARCLLALATIEDVDQVAVIAQRAAGIDLAAIVEAETTAVGGQLDAIIIEIAIEAILGMKSKGLGGQPVLSHRSRSLRSQTRCKPARNHFDLSLTCYSS